MSSLSRSLVEFIVRPSKTTLRTFNAIILLWASVNIFLGHHSFDPYPYNFLTLVLSWLAIVMTILIMINQQRQEDQNKEVLETILLLSKATQIMLKDQKDSLEDIKESME